MKKKVNGVTLRAVSGAPPKYFPGNAYTLLMQGPNEREVNEKLEALKELSSKLGYEEIRVLEMGPDPNGGYRAMVVAHNWNPITWFKERHSRNVEEALEKKSARNAIHATRLTPHERIIQEEFQNEQNIERAARKQQILTELKKRRKVYGSNISDAKNARRGYLARTAHEAANLAVGGVTSRIEEQLATEKEIQAIRTSPDYIRRKAQEATELNLAKAAMNQRLKIAHTIGREELKYNIGAKSVARKFLETGGKADAQRTYLGPAYATPYTSALGPGLGVEADEQARVNTEHLIQSLILYKSRHPIPYQETRKLLIEQDPETPPTNLRMQTALIVRDPVGWEEVAGEG